MQALKIIISILIAQSAGFVGSIFTSSSVNTWYTTVTKPSFNPPSWIFGPVWTTLYTLMGIASYIVWKQRQLVNTTPALTIYGIQLGLNALWSILFFGLQNPGLAFAEIIILLIFIIINTIMFWKINKWAGILMIPYILWVAFASFLNYNIWQLN